MATLPTAYQAKTTGLMVPPAIKAPEIKAPVAATTGYNATGVAGATKAVGSGYDPTLSKVNYKTDTVQGQIKSIIDQNSPLQQQAETRANQQMNTRGLMNSSMGIQAGQAALYDVAVPIATADANTYSATRLNNQNMSNTASQFGAAAKNTASLTNAQLGTDVSKFNADSTNTAKQFNAASANDMSKFNADGSLKASVVNQDQANQMAQFNTDNASKLAITALQNSADVAKFNASQSNDLIKLGMDSNTRMALANIEANYKTLMQTSSGASDLYKQYVTSSAAILANKDITNKAKAMNNITSQLNEGLGIIGDIANLDLGSYLKFSANATNTTAKKKSSSSSSSDGPTAEEAKKLPGESTAAFIRRLGTYGGPLSTQQYETGGGVD